MRSRTAGKTKQEQELITALGTDAGHRTGLSPQLRYKSSLTQHYLVFRPRNLVKAIRDPSSPNTCPVLFLQSYSFIQTLSQNYQQRQEKEINLS